MFWSIDTTELTQLKKAKQKVQRRRSGYVWQGLCVRAVLEEGVCHGGVCRRWRQREYKLSVCMSTSRHDLQELKDVFLEKHVRVEEMLSLITCPGCFLDALTYFSVKWKRWSWVLSRGQRYCQGQRPVGGQHREEASTGRRPEQWARSQDTGLFPTLLFPRFVIIML